MSIDELKDIRFMTFQGGLEKTIFPMPIYENDFRRKTMDSMQYYNVMALSVSVKQLLYMKNLTFFFKFVIFLLDCV